MLPLYVLYPPRETGKQSQLHRQQFHIRSQSPAYLPVSVDISSWFVELGTVRQIEMPEVAAGKIIYAITM